MSDKMSLVIRGCAFGAPDVATQLFAHPLRNGGVVVVIAPGHALNITDAEQQRAAMTCVMSTKLARELAAELLALCDEVTE